MSKAQQLQTLIYTFLVAQIICLLGILTLNTAESESQAGFFMVAVYGFMAAFAFLIALSVLLYMVARKKKVAFPRRFYGVALVSVVLFIVSAPLNNWLLERYQRQHECKEPMCTVTIEQQ